MNCRIFFLRKQMITKITLIIQEWTCVIWTQILTYHVSPQFSVKWLDRCHRLHSLSNWIDMRVIGVILASRCVFDNFLNGIWSIVRIVLVNLLVLNLSNILRRVLFCSVLPVAVDSVEVLASPGVFDHERWRTRIRSVGSLSDIFDVIVVVMMDMLDIFEVLPVICSIAVLNLWCWRINLLTHTFKNSLFL